MSDEKNSEMDFNANEEEEEKDDQEQEQEQEEQGEEENEEEEDTNNKNTDKNINVVNIDGTPSKITNNQKAKKNLLINNNEISPNNQLLKNTDLSPIPTKTQNQITLDNNDNNINSKIDINSEKKLKKIISRQKITN